MNKFIKYVDSCLEMLNEDIMIVEGISDIKKLYVDTNKIDGHVFDRLVEADPSPTKKYVQWLCKKYIEAKAKSATSTFLHELPAIKDFYELTEKNRINNKDIYGKDASGKPFYNDLEDVADIVNSVKTTKSKSEIKDGIHDETLAQDIDPKDIVYKNSKVIIVDPKFDFDKMVKYGKRNGMLPTWCTVGSSRDTYGPRYVYQEGSNFMIIIPLIDKYSTKHTKWEKVGNENRYTGNIDFVVKLEATKSGYRKYWRANDTPMSKQEVIRFSKDLGFYDLIEDSLDKVTTDARLQ